ncbi:cyclic nucleotide-binding domain-containing protein [Pseudomarimonas salicorniae]|uniref:Cyclic nucleotide-binding domain-containing protein n=1 Tax=Pseudomarimonas salicorniae TaxID=2933270 RepID=A0ABT0GN10_9GAMM|nr:cyclic nucleotide-binding domain-containing protein [Lysobacter sp. CAU 1642]MCK7595604.1 cyclic nucleotide-binding domain-containing protein [Lysobacter sp. CAU 1642]
MAVSARRLFQVLPDEGGKVLGFAILAAMLQAGVAIGMVAADSLFLAQLGVEKLPLVFIFMPVVMAVYAPIYSLLLGRLGAHGLFRLTLLLLIAGGLFFGLSAAQFAEQPWYLFAIKFYAGLWFIALYTLFWNFADDYFSILDGKRLFGLISAGSSAGAMLGGGLVVALSGMIPVASLFLIWAGLALLTWPVFAALLRRHRPIATDEEAGVEGSSLGALLRFAAGALRGSRFAVSLALICFLMVSLTALMDYMALGQFAIDRDAAELTRLLGLLHGLAGALTLLINLFLFNRIVGRLGVSGTALVLPLCYVAVFVFFFLEPGFVAAVVAFFAYQSLFVAVEYNNVNLLYGALPQRMKRQLRTFIEALAEPLATATAGLVLWYSAGSLDTSNLALSGLLVACLALLVAALIRHDYGRALAINLRADWLDFANPEEGWRRHLTETDFERLREVAREGAREQRLLAVDLLWRLRDPAAREALLSFLGDADAAEAEKLRPAISGLLQHDDTESLAETLLWLESDQAPSDPDVLEEFTGSGAFPVRQHQHWRHSRDPVHQAALAVARWNGTRLDDVAQAIGEIRGMLAGNAHARRMGIRAIGDCRHSRYYGELLPFLSCDDPELRREALRSTRKLASPETTQLLPQVLPLLRDAPSEERFLILDIAERTGDTSAIRSLLLGAEHFSAGESRRLEEVIRSMGLKAIPGVIHVLRDVAAPYHSRSIALRALSRLAMPQLLMVADELIDAELGIAERAVAAHRALVARRESRQGTGCVVLTRYYRDAAAQGLEFVLELLSLAGRLPDFDLIRASLSFANARDRANAVETIQQSCSRELFERIARLIDATVAIAGLDVVRQRGGQRSLRDLLRDAALSSVPLESSSGLIAHHELGLPGTPALLRERLELASDAHRGDWLIELLPRFAERAPDEPPPVHSVERVAMLVRAEFFSEARVLALDFLARHSEDRRVPAGELIYRRGDAADALFIVAEGEVSLSRESGEALVGPGATFGQRVLMGDPERGEDARSGGCRLLVLPGALVERAIEIFPSMGIGLYQFKTISAFS